MNLRFLIMHLITTTTVVGAINAQAQNAPLKTGTGLPDACKLMLQSDLEALFPGMPINGPRPTLSSIYQGVPQYNQSCEYSVQLPSPISKALDTKFVKLQIIQCDVCDAKYKVSAGGAFAHDRDSAKQAANQTHAQFGPLSGIGDEAFQETYDDDVTITARQDDLIFKIVVQKYSRQTQPNAFALASQATKRWRSGIGMVDAATSIPANTSVEVPADTRVSSTASADKWPDACVLLTREDVRKVFGDMTIEGPRKTMGQITYESRVDRVEKLPYPIGCHYTAHKTKTDNGQIIDLRVRDFAASVDVAKKRYEETVKIVDADTVVPGLGDQAGINIMNEIYIRKGALTVSVRVSGDDRDQALYADARREVNEIAKLIATKLP
jgi:hypothetical protein